MQLCAGINRCHIQLLAEKMTYTGTIASISRYTMRNEECGPMSKASFEESMDNFLKAGAYGQIETTNGVSASIICGKRAMIGTGICDLMINVKSLPYCSEILNDIVEEKKVIKISVKKKEEKEVVVVEKKKKEIDRLTEKDFIGCKYKAKIFFGTAEIIYNDSNEEELSITYDSKIAKEFVLTWKNGIKVGKEIFSGYDEINKCYMLLEDIDLVEQGRFMKIVGEPKKMLK